ncbi:MAG: cyanophycin synthetase [Candidatus Omnitrophota bacterium]
MIPKGVLASLVERLKPAAEDYNKYSEYGPLSFFEFYTSLALIYFKENDVDFAVLETGMGGRLDATNALNHLVAGITPVSYEHTQYLGPTLKDIAFEKAGIIKNKGITVISAPQEEEAAQVIRKRCKETGASLYEINRDITYRENGNGFDIRGVYAEYPDLKIKLLGTHQIINAAVALGIVEALRLHNINVGHDAIRSGLYSTLWPGRCEVISTDPLVVLDGAQNVASARALKETVKKIFEYRKLILVLGICADKDINGICSEVYNLADKVILTKSGNPRASEPADLAKYFDAKEVHITDSVDEARRLALRIGKKEDLILVCGSLFVVGEFRDARI